MQVEMQRTYHFSLNARTTLDEALSSQIARHGVRRRFLRNAAVIHQGDAGNGFWLIETGTVTVCRFDDDGAKTIYAVLGPGDLLGELAFFAGIKRQVDAIADCDAELVWIDRGLCDRLLTTDPGFARYLLGSLSSQLRTALDRIESGQRHSAKERLLRLLAEMSGQQGSTVACTQQELADLLGVSRVTVGQLLGRIAGAGLIERKYRSLRIADPQALLDEINRSR